jgi:hypothetical protein
MAGTPDIELGTRWNGDAYGGTQRSIFGSRNYCEERNGLNSHSRPLPKSSCLEQFAVYAREQQFEGVHNPFRHEDLLGQPIRDLLSKNGSQVLYHSFAISKIKTIQKNAALLPGTYLLLFNRPILNLPLLHFYIF